MCWRLTYVGQRRLPACSDGPVRYRRSRCVITLGEKHVLPVISLNHEITSKTTWSFAEPYNTDQVHDKETMAKHPSASGRLHTMRIT